jgi:glycosyltransferase involved in cell wall biosynthesis
VVYNGVDLEHYTPSGVGKILEDQVRVILVEGSISGGYEWGLETAIHMCERIKNVFHHNIEVMVVGKVSAPLQGEWKRKAEVSVNFSGQVSSDMIPELDRTAHVLYAADLNTACPNSVIEAMACGLPVVAFDTGALSELVSGDAGRLVPFGGDPWKLDPPDINGLAEAANIIINEQDNFRKAARRRAEEAFGLDRMVEGYLNALNL